MGGAEDEDKACKVVSAVLSAEQMLNKHTVRKSVFSIYTQCLTHNRNSINISERKNYYDYNLCSLEHR